MARYILLEVADNEQASALVHEIETWGYLQAQVQIPETQAGETSTEIEVPVFVRALWGKPTLFCDERGPGGAHRGAGLTRGKKFGWMVCAHPGCGRADGIWAQGHGWYNVFGNNMLPISEKRPEWRGGGPLAKHWNGKEWVDKEVRP